MSACRELATCKGKNVELSCPAKRLSMTGPRSPYFVYLVPDVHSEAEVSCWHPRWQLKNAYETTMTSLSVHVHGCHDTAATSCWCLDIHSNEVLIHDKLAGIDANVARSGHAKIRLKLAPQMPMVSTSDWQVPTSMEVLRVHYLKAKYHTDQVESWYLVQTRAMASE